MPHGTGATQTGKLRLWDATETVGDYCDIYSDVNGALRLDPGGLGNINFSVTSVIGSAAAVLSGSLATQSELSSILGYRVSNTDTDVETQGGYHITSNHSWGGFYGERNSASIHFMDLKWYTEHASGVRTDKLILSYGGNLDITTGSLSMGSTEIVDSSRNATFAIIDATSVYQMDGATIIDTDANQVGAFKTRQTLLFGNSSLMTATSTTVTTDGRTVNGVLNTQGYRMVRDGIVTGISLQFRCTDATSIGSLTATVQDNASNTSMSVAYPVGGAGTISVSDNLGHQSTSSAFEVSAGDRINVELSLLEIDGDTCSVDDIAVVVDFLA
jgi:hypothetical protein